jgi:hypothetical protein
VKHLFADVGQRRVHFTNLQVEKEANNHPHDSNNAVMGVKISINVDGIKWLKDC